MNKRKKENSFTEISKAKFITITCSNTIKDNKRPASLVRLKNKNMAANISIPPVTQLYNFELPIEDQKSISLSNCPIGV
ncbi:MAG: hypothetical protein IPM85_15685 [Chitinophagaceae bacterium]|nr:hypothetical protein [Chitinophagaceae bacterium]